LPDLRLSEQLGIVVSSWFYRSCSSLFVDHPFFTIALHEPVRFSNACSLRRSRSAAQLNVGNRRASRGVTERYEGLRRSPLKPTTSAMGLVSRVLPVHTAVRNCTRDEGGPFEVGNQVLTLSHRKLLSSKARVVNVAETPGRDSGRQG
jgi:hypothetical protein